MNKVKLPLVPPDTCNIMKMSASVRVRFFLYISAAHMSNVCTTQHSYRNIVVGKDAHCMKAKSGM